jgi:eukaryotic-like serine/threonine-protein kinase
MEDPTLASTDETPKPSNESDPNPGKTGPRTTLGPAAPGHETPARTGSTSAWTQGIANSGSGEPESSAYDVDPYLHLGAVDRCTLESAVGKGGMGVVYKARHRDLDIDVAVKFLHPHLAQAPGASGRFLREARLAARLQSAGIVRVFTCGEVEGQFFIVMEFVDGQTLSAHIAERKSIPVGRALQIAETVAGALREALDQIGLIHRDIKPSNILLTSSGQAKLADLGLAKTLAPRFNATGFETAAGAILGTPSYMPPEQFVDAGNVDHRADIFSLGATLYQMLSGRPPFVGDNFPAVLKQVMELDPPPLPDFVPEIVRALVARMMAKRPEDRFQTYDELIDDLRRAQRSLGGIDGRASQSPSMVGRPLTIADVAAAGEEISRVSPTENRVLLVVDIQNDFCPGGALAVPGGHEIVPVINRLARRFAHVVLTQDWHREDHLSFASSHPGKKPHDRVALSYGEQILWPDHCVERTPGAEFHPQLDVANCELIVRKGYHRDIDSYSAFFENDRRTPTGLTGYLRERGLVRLFIVGLATDFCVAYSALDARRLGFEVTIIEAACRGIDLDGSLAAAWREMEAAGVIRA